MSLSPDTESALRTPSPLWRELVDGIANGLDFDACILPDSFRELVRIIGSQDAIRLVVALGGREIVPPARVTEANELVKVIGMNQAQRLAEQWTAGKIYLPLLEHLKKCLRNQTIVAEYDAGVGVRQLVKRHQISERQIWNILSKPTPYPSLPGRTPQPEDPRQLRLHFLDLDGIG